MMQNVVLQVDSKIVLISAPNKIGFLFEVLVELNFHCGFVTVVFVQNELANNEFLRSMEWRIFFT